MDNNMSLTAWLARQITNPRTDNGWTVSELDRRLQNTDCAIGACSADNISYINRTGAPNEEVEAEMKEFAAWQQSTGEDFASSDRAPRALYGFKLPDVPDRASAILVVSGAAPAAMKLYDALQEVFAEVEKAAEAAKEAVVESATPEEE